MKKLLFVVAMFAFYSVSMQVRWQARVLVASMVV